MRYIITFAIGLALAPIAFTLGVWWGNYLQQQAVIPAVKLAPPGHFNFAPNLGCQKGVIV